jgi:hypothetical protein
MELSPCREAFSCAAVRELLTFYGNRRFIAVFPALSQINPVHNTQSPLSKIV